MSSRKPRSISRSWSPRRHNAPYGAPPRAGAPYSSRGGQSAKEISMSDARSYSSDVAFTPAVKAVQARKGSRETYARVEERGGWRTEIDETLAGCLEDANSFYLATASATGQPYIQHRGG